MASRNNIISVSSRSNRTIRITEHGPEEKKEDDLMQRSRYTKTTTSRTTTSARRVQFHQLTIREYPIEIGDNPASIAGPSLSMGWRPFSQVHVTVDEYETHRPERRRGREMIVPSDLRFERLRQAGFSRNEIVAATRPVNIVRAQRRRTRETLQLQSFQEINEKVGRKFLNVLTGGKRKKDVQKLVDHHVRANESCSPLESAPVPIIVPVVDVYKPSRAFPELPPTVSSASSSDSEMLA